MTGPGQLLLLLTAIVGVGAFFRPSPAIVLAVCLLAFYLFTGWLSHLAWSLHLSRRRLSVRRILPVSLHETIASQGQTMVIELALQGASSPGGGRLRVEEILPEGMTPVGGQASSMESLPNTVRYTLHFEHAGTILLPGVVVRRTDMAGLFRHESFLPLPLRIHVLPRAGPADQRPSGRKTTNRLLPIGVHLHPQRGTSAELLELREYRSDDPPRSIDWKASARRDRLISREFESEVTIRTTLFLDTSDSMRLGPRGATALARSAPLVAGWLTSTLDSRDPIGLCLFRETDARSLPPAIGGQHRRRLLQALADVLHLGPESTPVPLEGPFEAIWNHASVVHRDALDRSINRPLRGLLTAWRTPGIGPISLAGRLGAMVGVGNAFDSIQRRKRMAVLLAAWFELGPDSPGRLLADNDLFCHHLLAYARDQGRRTPLPTLDRDGRFLFHNPAKIDTLAQELTRAILAARDNEAYVIVADFDGIEGHLESLRESLQMARAYHHRVLALVPVAPEPSGDTALDETFRDEARFGFDRTRRFFARAAVPCLALKGEESVSSILGIVAQLRHQRGA